MIISRSEDRKVMTDFNPSLLSVAASCGHLCTYLPFNYTNLINLHRLQWSYLYTQLVANNRLPLFKGRTSHTWDISALESVT